MQNTGKYEFSVLFQLLSPKTGWRDGLLCFIGKLCKLVPEKLEHKLQAAVPVLCGYFFNLNNSEKKNYSFLIAKVYNINFYQQLLVRVCLTKRKQFV